MVTEIYTCVIRRIFCRFSFQKEQDVSRMLRGVMRVGHLAKGLLLKGDNQVELVVLCADKPTLTLLKKVVDLLPAAFKQVRKRHVIITTLCRKQLFTQLLLGLMMLLIG